MRAIVVAVVLLTGCGGLEGLETSDPDAGGRCAGNLPAVCDGRCSWRCIDGQWRTGTPCFPCVCVNAVCFSPVP